MNDFSMRQGMQARGSVQPVRSAGFGLANVSVFVKVMVIAVIALLATICVGVVADLQMASIGREMKAIDKEDIPLTKALSELEIAVKSQELLLERMMRIAGMPDTGGQTFEQLTREFEALKEKSNEHIFEAANLAKEGEKEAISTEMREEMRSLNSKLSKISGELASFEADADQMIRLLAAKRVPESAVIAAKMLKDEAELDQHILDSLHEVESFTANAIATAVEHEEAALQLIIAITLASAVVVIFASWYITSRYISTPLREVSDAMTRLSGGDLEAHVDYAASDEVGAIALTFESFRQRMIEIKRMQEQQKELEKSAAQERRNVLVAMADSFEREVGTIVQTVASAANQMQATSSTMARVAADTSSRALSVSAGAEQASANVGTVAAATEELSASVNEIGRQLSASNEAAQVMSGQAADTEAKVKSLVEAAAKIGEVVALIDNIASQTNLLALNATIEAARAGDAGKGFSVVASEVKNLASQTSKATEEITRTIATIQRETKEANLAIAKITVSVSSITSATGSISIAVEEQGDATRNISRNIQEAATGTSDVSRNIGAVRDGSVQTEQAASEVLSTAAELSRQATHLSDEVRKFMAGLRNG